MLTPLPCEASIALTDGIWTVESSNTQHRYKRILFVGHTFGQENRSSNSKAIFSILSGTRNMNSPTEHKSDLCSRPSADIFHENTKLFYLKEEITSVEDRSDKVKHHPAKSYQYHIVHSADNRPPCFLQENGQSQQSQSSHSVVMALQELIIKYQIK